MVPSKVLEKETHIPLLSYLFRCYLLIFSLSLFQVSGDEALCKGERRETLLFACLVRKKVVREEGKREGLGGKRNRGYRKRARMRRIGFRERGGKAKG